MFYVFCKYYHVRFLFQLNSQMGFKSFFGNVGSDFSNNKFHCLFVCFHPLIVFILTNVSFVFFFSRLSRISFRHCSERGKLNK